MESVSNRPMKYYYPEHLAGYERIKAEGKTAWAEIHGGSGFENFASREFLEAVLPRLRFADEHPAALELGCGTGPGACFLAEQGFRVDGIDLIPAAIEIACAQARKRGLDIYYEVMDVVELPHEGKPYDLIVDSYCLQCIVTDSDRDKLFAAVRARLKPQGYYVISTAYFEDNRCHKDESVIDESTGTAYYRYGENCLFDPAADIVYSPVEQEHCQWEDSVRIAGKWYLPNRRHRRPEALKAELTMAGFNVLDQDKGNMLCSHKGAVKKDKA
ncbi:MAG: class I SAM-dependent methyltransferase [Planctomycetota bacterium]|nr:class I SAM-dependent methyltransferase [Planctomycetota bacterium]